MTKVKDVGKAVETGGGLAPQRNTLGVLLDSVAIRKRFTEVLGKKAPGFISSILAAVGTNDKLKVCDPMSVISSAAIAATLDLPINPSLGFAHIVPYGGKAQFQMGWRGFVQLAMRSGQFKTMNVAAVYEGELLDHNRITGEMTFGAATGTNVIGYVAYFKLLNGFEKYYYMTRAEVEKHGKRYSKSFTSEGGQWQQNFDAMALKTVIKMLLSKFGILSIEMQRAIETDQAVITEEGTPEYVDSLAAPKTLRPAVKTCEMEVEGEVKNETPT